MIKSRGVAGLDVHKDTIILCIMSHDGSIIFEKDYGTLSPPTLRGCARRCFPMG